MSRLGINMHAMRGLSDDGYLKLIKAFGFDATFTFSKGERADAIFGELCNKYGIDCESLHAPFEGINTLWDIGSDGDAVLERLKRSVDACVLVGARILVVHLSSGSIPPPVTDIGRGRFTELVGYACSKSVKLAVENLRSLANIAWVMETFPPEMVGFCWDVGHEMCYTPSIRFMPLYAQRLTCVHIHDNMCVNNDDLHLIPFDGVGNFGYVARALARACFDGTLMLEVIAAQSRGYDAMSVSEYLKNSIDAAERLCDMLEVEKNA